MGVEGEMCRSSLAASSYVSRFLDVFVRTLVEKLNAISVINHVDVYNE